MLSLSTETRVRVSATLIPPNAQLRGFWACVRSLLWTTLGWDCNNADLAQPLPDSSTCVFHEWGFLFTWGEEDG